MGLRIKFLGTGAAEGIPAINCDCDHCTRAKLEGGSLVRARNAIIISLPRYELLIDTPPDVRSLLSKNKVRRIDGVFLTHSHYDHSGGLEEFLYWKADLDLFAEPTVYEALQREDWGNKLPEIAFYCPCHPGRAVRFDGFFFTPFAVHHTVPCFGLVLYENDRKIVYTSDTGSRFSNYAQCLMLQADLLIINTPSFFPPHEGHITSIEALELKKRVAAKRLILTHFNHHNHPHDKLEEWAKEQEGVTIAYDGLEIEF